MTHTPTVTFIFHADESSTKVENLLRDDSVICSSQWTNLAGCDREWLHGPSSCLAQQTPPLYVHTNAHTHTHTHTHTSMGIHTQIGQTHKLFEFTYFFTILSAQVCIFLPFILSAFEAFSVSWVSRQ